MKLPDKPSELITLALNDLAKCERSKRYKIDMDDWHMPNSQCAVCLAGAVMAKTLGADPTEWLCPSDFPEAFNLLALDNFRLGQCSRGFSKMGLTGGHVFARDIEPYDRSAPKEFRRDMRKLARDLKAAGY